MVFGQKLKISISAKKDIIGKGISRGTEWSKFQLHSTFQWSKFQLYRRNRDAKYDVYFDKSTGCLQNILFYHNHFTHLPPSHPHTLTTHPTASHSPVGQYPSEKICELKSCCCTCLPSLRSQQRTVLSSEPVQSLVPSGEISMQLAPSVWP